MFFIMVTLAAIAGYRKYGILIAIAGPYYFFYMLTLNGEFIATGGPWNTLIGVVFGLIIAPAFFTTPYVVTGYLLGVTLRSIQGLTPI